MTEREELEEMLGIAVQRALADYDCSVEPLSELRRTYGTTEHGLIVEVSMRKVERTL